MVNFHVTATHHADTVFVKVAPTGREMEFEVPPGVTLTEEQVEALVRPTLEEDYPSPIHIAVKIVASNN